MISWALASMLLIASTEGAQGEEPTGLRTHCHQGAALEYQSERDSIRVRIFPRLRGRYHVGNFDGGTLQGRIKGEHSELLHSEEGRFRRVMETRGRVLSARASSDNNHLAVAVSRQEDPNAFRPAMSTLYLVDTNTWEAEAMVRSFGYTGGMSWSPEGHRIAVADFSNLRIYDTKTGEVLEHCLLDNVTVPDGNEWVRYVRWLDDDTITFDYEYTGGRYRYQVKLK